MKTLTREEMDAMTQHWTRDEIINTLEQVSQKRLGTGIKGFIAKVNANELDRCEFVEMTGLLALLPKNDPIFQES